jgi:anti-sigma factor RsiW
MGPDGHPDHEQWTLFYYHELPPQEARRLEEHLRGCGECNRAFSEWRRIQSLVTLQVPEPLPARWAQLRSAVIHEFRRRTSAGRLELLVEDLTQGVAWMWNYLTEDPMAAMAYVSAAIAYLIYSLSNVSGLQSLIPNTEQVLSLIRLAF